MANNRTEFKSQVTNLIKAIVSILKHRQVLNDELADSINFRKDVKSSTIVATASANSIDFTTNDLVTIDAATNNLSLTLTILNTQDGEDSKYIRVLKDSGYSVNFSGATDISSSDIITQTEIFYEVFNKNGNIFARALGGSPPSIEYEIGSWNMDADASKAISIDILWTKIRSVSVIIQNDTLATVWDLNGGGYSGNIGSGNLTLFRTTGGIFDNASFDSTSVQRGWVTIEYEIY